MVLNPLLCALVIVHGKQEHSESHSYVAPFQVPTCMLTHRTGTDSTNTPWTFGQSKDHRWILWTESSFFKETVTISSEFLSLHWIRYIPVLWIQWNLDIINPQQSFARSDLSSVHVFSYMVNFFPNDLIQKPPKWMRKTPTNLTNNSWTIRTYRKSYFYRLPWSSAATWAGALSCCTRSATSGHPCWRSR